MHKTDAALRRLQGGCRAGRCNREEREVAVAAWWSGNHTAPRVPGQPSVSGHWGAEPGTGSGTAWGGRPAEGGGPVREALEALRVKGGSLAASTRAGGKTQLGEARASVGHGVSTERFFAAGTHRSPQARDPSL